MPIPDFQTLMLPALRLMGDQLPHLMSEVRERIAKDLQLTPEELSQKLASGTSLFANRLAWAVSFLRKAQALNPEARGVYRITDRGLDLLKQDLPKITVKTLKQFPEIVQMYKSASNAQAAVAPIKDAEPTLTPEEQIQDSFETLRDALADELLEVVKKSNPAAFEAIVVDLLVAIGYGGTLKNAGNVVGKSGDGGIDGTIKQDQLGLDVVYVQAKLWKANVGSSDARDFCGSLIANQAQKGVMITTSQFSKEANDFIKRIPQRIILVGGKQLAELMIEHNVGVASLKTYTLKRLDQDYFENL